MVALKSSCCRLGYKRTTKHQKSLAMSGYLCLIYTDWNFVFLQIVLSRERCSHVPANVKLLGVLYTPFGASTTA